MADIVQTYGTGAYGSLAYGGGYKPVNGWGESDQKQASAWKDTDERQASKWDGENKPVNGWSDQDTTTPAEWHDDEFENSV